jgi:hypothetical protein
MAKKSVVVSSAYASVKPLEARDIRKVSCSLLVFCLLFCQKPCEGDDIGVDASTLAIAVGSHPASVTSIPGVSLRGV